jgi:hypothetical protein
VRILISGSRGLLGGALVSFLEDQGDSVVRLVRSLPVGESQRFWDPARGELDRRDVEGFDAVIHLGGENIAAGRWTTAQKKRLWESRVESTRLLADRIRNAQSSPAVFLCASAVGIYGDRGGEVLRETSDAGRGFLASLGQSWEEASRVTERPGTRVVQLRFGIILSSRGGALQKMLPAFRLGLGGKIGGGRQYWSWIEIGDAVRAIRHTLSRADLGGPLNCVSPGAVTNAEFTRTLGEILHRPAFFVVPAFLARLAFGEMAQETLLASQRVEPVKLLQSGYTFLHPDLRSALLNATNPAAP